ncbi:MAG: hypothetical protein NVSMB3_12110 [Acidobacteriaceae bacterium]
MLGQAQQPALPDGPQQQQAIPDAPRPQTALPTNGVAPGKGATPDAPLPQPAADQNAPGSTLPSSTSESHPDDGAPPELPAAGDGAKAFTIRTQTNFVQVPFTVKDSKGRLVPGLTWRDVRVFENGYRQKIDLFTVDPFPLSVALVIDQSVTFDTMTKINNSLGALQGAFTPYDEVAVFTYNNGPQMRTDFTAAQGARLSAVLQQSKGAGREPLYYDPTGPLGQNINVNSGAQQYIDPNTNSRHGTSLSNTINVPKDVHTLNDAILEAAKATTRTGKERRRIVYVISDGKEYGSVAKSKDVIKYLNTNKIAVYATLIHDTPQIPGLGFLDRVHLPLQMRDNILPAYVFATGGQVDPEFRQRGIESSFAKITEEVRTQYTLGYYTREPFIDGKYRKLEVKVLRPGLTVIAKDGYYPTASDSRPSTVRSAQ